MADDTDAPMPGQFDFTAGQERAMRQAGWSTDASGETVALPQITVKPAQQQNLDDDFQATPDNASFRERFNANPQGQYAVFRSSTNIEDDRNKPEWQQAIETATEKPMAEITEKVIHPFSSGNRFKQGQAPFTPPGQIVPSQ